MTEPSEYQKEDIWRYLESQLHGDEDVVDVEHITSRSVLGNRYEVWDARTDKSRWWVFTNLTNLYSQEGEQLT